MQQNDTLLPTARMCSSSRSQVREKLREAGPRGRRGVRGVGVEDGFPCGAALLGDDRAESCTNSAVTLILVTPSSEAM